MRYCYELFTFATDTVIMGIKENIQSAQKSGEKLFGVLLDPDKLELSKLESLMITARDTEIDYFMLGGSHISEGMSDECVAMIVEQNEIPVILFPGSPMQINSRADALLFLSLVSGRNPDLLIGQHVTAAPYIKRSGLEIISTAYMLIDGGRPTTVTYISNTQPIPNDKPSIAASTALASEMLGFSQIFMDAGSGAQQHVPREMIIKVRETVEIPIVVGGGIKTAEEAYQVCRAGADFIIVGNAIEKNPGLIREISSAVKSDAQRV